MDCVIYLKHLFYLAFINISIDITPNKLHKVT